MAHAFTMFPGDPSGYTNRLKSSDQAKYPKTAFFQGPLQVSRVECDVTELETSGEIPKEINGTFYRVQPDPQFPPMYEEDVNFSGDGNVTAFVFRDGHVDLKQRYVRTDRFKAERESRKALFGKYRNPYTDSEMVKGIIRTVSNTNVYFWRGALLASKEDGPPYAMDPKTLETTGRYDFEGQMKAPASRRTPRSTRIRVRWWLSHTRRAKTQESWYKAPFCGMIHDCALTKNYLILPMTPIVADLERIKKGGNHWAWDPTKDQCYGIVPRKGGKPEDIVWLRAENGFHGHVAGAYEDENGHIVCDLTVADGNVFFWWPPDDAGDGAVQKSMPQRQRLISDTFRWVFDPKSPTDTRVTPAPMRAPAGGLWNVIGHYNWDTGAKDEYFAGPTCTFQEPVFVPKAEDSPEGEGYLMTLLNHLDVQRNDLVIFDALDLAKGPVAALHLPVRMRMGLHGNFVPQSEIDDWNRRRGGEEGPVQVATEPLPWQTKLAEAAAAAAHQNGSNGASDTNGATNGTNGVNGTNGTNGVHA
ncbi:unnamed protein product [Parascedosporium putredinis]|uniref:Carotenoid oxygenase n=1 Tax=Parascedosporium putredinis TaxID=1442378 RepID=A0A9P1MA74_9PEZI|nr:unnamed protein product [Parascedosporium putredinis]CAI7993426.1 unnamed protein product [Parascedosporium putredinis]